MNTMKSRVELNATASDTIVQLDDLILELNTISMKYENDLEQGKMTWERLGTLQHYVATIRQMLGKVN